MSDDIVRHSKAAVVEALSDPEEIAKKEAQNALLQAERMNQVILDGLYGDRPFRLRPSLLLDLNRKAIDGLSQFAGLYRPGSVEIQKSKHQPPGAHLVPELVEQMCDYVNEHWQTATAVHLAAYTLWRINWIHPFTDGNGRTARSSCLYCALHKS